MSPRFAMLAATLLAGATAAHADEFEIKRIFSSSDFSTTIVIAAPAAASIKCAVYDKDENPLRVETTRVTPPLDEVLILTGDVTSQVDSAECWKME